jgi:tRNA(His) 5'-end guanylyltransferase
VFLNKVDPFTCNIIDARKNKFKSRAAATIVLNNIFDMLQLHAEKLGLVSYDRFVHLSIVKRIRYFFTISQTNAWRFSCFLKK